MIKRNKNRALITERVNNKTFDFITGMPVVKQWHCNYDGYKYHNLTYLYISLSKQLGRTRLSTLYYYNKNNDTNK